MKTTTITAREGRVEMLHSLSCLLIKIEKISNEENENLEFSHECQVLMVSFSFQYFLSVDIP